MKLAGKLREVARRRARQRIDRQANNFVTAAKQLLQQIQANESGAAGDERCHARSLS